MSVGVDVKGLLRQWANQHQSLLIGFLPVGEPAPESLIEQFDQCVETANALAADRGQGNPGSTVHGWRAWSGPQGPVSFVSPADSRGEVENWLADLRDALERRGLAGKLRPATTQAPEIIRHRQPVLTALLCVTGWQSGSWGQAVSPWNENSELRRHLAEWACGWAAQEPGDLFLSQGVGRFLVPATAARASIKWRPDGSQLLWSPELGRMRTVTFCPTGRLIVQLKDARVSWQENLQVLRDVIREHAQILELAQVRYSYSNVITSKHVVDMWPPRLPAHPSNDTPRDYYHFRRGLDHERVPDASGLQLLTDAHLALAHDLSAWRTESVGPGVHLVEASELATWFKEAQPSREVLASAREGFGEMILWTRPALPPLAPASPDVGDQPQ